MDGLFEELAQTDGEGWARAESDIERIWSRSGSASMDLLRKRGEDALDMGDVPAALGHLTALTDHAPDFAQGWQLRAEAFYLSGQFGPAVSDLAQAVQIEPRNWLALTQLGRILEEIGDGPRAIGAFRASLAVNPHQQEARDALARLERAHSGTGI